MRRLVAVCSICSLNADGNSGRRASRLSAEMAFQPCRRCSRLASSENEICPACTQMGPADGIVQTHVPLRRFVIGQALRPAAVFSHHAEPSFCPRLHLCQGGEDGQLFVSVSAQSGHCKRRHLTLLIFSEKGTPPPGAVVTARRMLTDPRTEALYGERVPYVISKGLDGPQLQQAHRALTPEEFLSNGYASHTACPPCIC